METEQTVLVMGASSGRKKDGSSFYKVDLYMPGTGAFDKSTTAEEYVKLSAVAPGTPMLVKLKYAIQEQQVKAGDRSFSVRRLGVQVGDLSLPENAKKAS